MEDILEHGFMDFITYYNPLGEVYHDMLSPQASLQVRPKK